MPSSAFIVRSTTCVRSSSTTIAPAPPVSGFYIVGEDVYSTGVLIYGVHLGIPEYYVLGIAYNLPEGAEIRSPRDGFMSFANFVLEQSGTLHTAGAVDLSTFFPDGNPLAASSEYGFGVTGNGLEFLIAQAGEVVTGDVIAIVSDPRVQMDLGQGEYNVFITLLIFDDEVHFFVPDVETLAEYFPYAFSD